VKTQIIRLEEHDDIVSTRDKMGWGQTGRILLVWPEQEIILTHRLDLVLLLRRAAEVGAQLALVVSHPDVREYADELGIPVFDNARQAQSVRWRRPRRRRMHWRSRDNDKQRLTAYQLITTTPHRAILSPKNLPLPIRLTLFALSMLAILALAAAVLPSAQITLQPAIHKQEITLSVSANPGITTINLAGNLPAYLFTTILEGTASITATGSVLIPDQYAIGEVRFTNLSTTPITIPLGTIVSAPLTETVRFATTRAVTLPAIPNSTRSVPIRALIPGSSGNLPNGSIRVVEGVLSYDLSVTNTQPTSRGSERAAPSPTGEDRSLLYDRLVSWLRQNALAELEARISTGDMLLLPTLSLKDTLERNYEPAGEQPADRLQLNLRLEFQVYVVWASDLKGLGTALLDANLPKGYAPIAGTLQVTALTQPALVDDLTTRWKLYAQRSVQADISNEEAISLSLGQSPAEAYRRLITSLPLGAPPRITLDPQWWPFLPFIPLRISVLAEGAGE
jgi:hypothetical protein